MRNGARYLGEDKCEFVVWAPFKKHVRLKILSSKDVSSKEEIIPMERDGRGYWKKVVENISPGTRYRYQLVDDKGEEERSDPASHYQPEGVHEASEVVDHTFTWEDGCWNGIDLSEMVIYEIHVGTFSQEGTFDAIVKRLDEIKEIGINTIELMPVAQFPGERNWGYDGVYPFAVQNSYGGPEALKKLVNECHKKGMSVILDVVYNHLGPEGNYLRDYGPYFTNKYRTPWGDAVNFDDEYSDEVRKLFIDNKIYWLDDYHIDALRLDAIHAIFDKTPKTFLFELSEEIEKFSKKKGRRFYLIAESNENDSKVIRSREQGGYGIDAQWCDDFHHSLRTLLTGDRSGYYVDFGAIGHLVKSFREGFVYSGQYSIFRKRSHGISSKERPASQFIVFSQNHDQIGNRMLGERLSSIVSSEALKLAASLVLFSPYIPLIFMGEEYGETAPFLYFVNLIDQHVIASVRKGRKDEFKEFRWKGEPPDPQGEETFHKSTLKWESRNKGKHRVLLNYYKNLIELRKYIPALSNLDKNSLEVYGTEEEKAIFLRRWKEDDNSHVLCLFNLNAKDIRLTIHVPFCTACSFNEQTSNEHQATEWTKRLDSSEKIWNGPGSLLPETIRSNDEITMRGHSVAMYVRS